MAWTTDGTVTGFAFSPDSNWVFTGGEDGRVKRWPVDGDGKPQRTWRPEKSGKPVVGQRRRILDGTEIRLIVLGADKVRLLDPER